MHFNPVQEKLLPQHIRQSPQRMFTRHVRRVSGDGHESECGRDEGDVAGTVLGNHEFCDGMCGVGLNPVGCIHPGGEVGRGVFKEISRVGRAGAEENSVGSEAGVFGYDIFERGSCSGWLEERVGEELEYLVRGDTAGLV